MPQFFRRTGLVLLIMGSVYGIAIALPRYIEQHKKPKNNDVQQIRTKLSESHLTVETLASLSDGNPSTVIALESLKNRLKQSNEELEKLIPAGEDELGVETTKTLASIKANHKKFLEELEARYSMLSKALSYTPATDLNLSLSEQGDEVSLRAEAASKALNDLSAKQTSNELQSALKNSSACFKKVVGLIAVKDLETASRSKAFCIQDYTETLKAAILYVTESFRSNQAQSLRQSALDQLKKLDAIISNSTD